MRAVPLAVGLFVHRRKEYPPELPAAQHSARRSLGRGKHAFARLPPRSETRIPKRTSRTPAVRSARSEISEKAAACHVCHSRRRSVIDSSNRPFRTSSVCRLRHQRCGRHCRRNSFRFIAISHCLRQGTRRWHCAVQCGVGQTPAPFPCCHLLSQRCYSPAHLGSWLVLTLSPRCCSPPFSDASSSSRVNSGQLMSCCGEAARRAFQRHIQVLAAPAAVPLYSNATAPFEHHAPGARPTRSGQRREPCGRLNGCVGDRSIGRECGGRVTYWRPLCAGIHQFDWGEFLCAACCGPSLRPCCRRLWCSCIGRRERGFLREPDPQRWHGARCCQRHASHHDPDDRASKPSPCECVHDENCAPHSWILRGASGDRYVRVVCQH